MKKITLMWKKEKKNLLILLHHFYMGGEIGGKALITFLAIIKETKRNSNRIFSF